MQRHVALPRFYLSYWCQEFNIAQLIASLLFKVVEIDRKQNQAGHAEHPDNQRVDKSNFYHNDSR